MKRKITITLILLAISISLNTAGALPPPCSEDQLLQSSDYAVQGTVLKVYCGTPYNSNECKPIDDQDSVYEPELFSNCAATILITKNLKGDRSEGQKVVIPFVRVARACEGGTHIIPGSPTYELSVGEEIKYYKSQECRFWNIQRINGESSTKN